MITLAVVALATSVLFGCTPETQIFSDATQVINTEVNKEFSIALHVNITTGYSWQVAHDSNVLKLLQKTYRELNKTGKQIGGVSGTEYFSSKALTRGETKVTFTYRRPWEQPSAQDQTLVFTVDVK